MVVRDLRWPLLTCVGAACLGLALLAGRGGPSNTLPPRVSLDPLVIQGFRSTLYKGDGSRLRISGDSLTLFRPKLIGPFSLGFMYAVTARNVTVETFRTGDGTAEPALASSLTAIPALLAQQHPNFEVAEARLAPIKVIEHRDGETRVVLTAAACSAELRSPEIECRDGAMDREGASVRFRKLWYDGKTKATHLAE
jgi:hypothetical protein